MTWHPAHHLVHSHTKLALQDFAGSALVVSHDRWFLDRVCTHTLAFEPHGVEFFEGGVSQYATWAAKYGRKLAG